MNKFVDEHTVLMREFLRNISTNSYTIDLQVKNNSSTDSLSSATTTSSINDARKLDAANEDMNSDNESNNNKESKFSCDLIDSGKQLSILHSLLVNIMSSLDKVNLLTGNTNSFVILLIVTQKQVALEKLNPLSEILSEISSLKNTIKFNQIIYPKSQQQHEKSIPIVINTQNYSETNQTVPQMSSHSASLLTSSLIPTTTKLTVHEHSSSNLNKHEHHDHHLRKSNSDQISLPIKIASAALDGVNSVTKLLHNHSADNSSNFTVSNESSSSSPPSPSLTYSSEATINLINLKQNLKVNELKTCYLRN